MGNNPEDTSPPTPGDAGLDSQDGEGTDAALAGDDGVVDSADDEPSMGLGEKSGPGAVPEGTSPGGADVAECAETEPGVSHWLRLSTLQYRNTVRDLLEQLGLAELNEGLEDALDSIPNDSLVNTFRGLDGRDSIEHVEGYFGVGQQVGDALVAEPRLLSVLAGSCAETTPLTTACATTFLSEFLSKVYRRPVEDDELAEYLLLNDGQRTAEQAIRAMVVVALSSPRFISHVEVDGTAVATSADLLQLTTFEIASRLSYALWQTMPDEELMASAADGSLVTEAGFEAQVKRLFSDARSKTSVWQFWKEWLLLEKFTGFEVSRPAFQALAQGTAIGQEGQDYYADMVQEVRSLTELFTFERPGTLADLLSTDISVTRSSALAELYGVAVYDGGDEYPSVANRAGLLQRAALLVSNLESTNPFHRGALIRRALLCDNLPIPDPNSLPVGALDPPPVDTTQTTRQRFEAKIQDNQLCSPCHNSFSDIGYVLESYDALGRYRTSEVVFDEQTGERLAELPLVTAAVARIDLADDTPVADAQELNLRIVDSLKVDGCLAQNYFTYALRRTPAELSTDSCVIADLKAALGQEQDGLAGAFRRLVRYDGFFQRKVGAR